jgi:hypothetical protein
MAGPSNGANLNFKRDQRVSKGASTLFCCGLRPERHMFAQPGATPKLWTTRTCGWVFRSLMCGRPQGSHWPPTEAAYLMVGTFSAPGFGNVLTSDPTFGVTAFWTFVGPI